MLHWKCLLPCYMCTHVDSWTERCHHGRYLRSYDLWSPRGKLNSCIPNMPCSAPHWQLNKWKPRIQLPSRFLLQPDHFSDFISTPSSKTVHFWPIIHLSAPAAFPPPQHLQRGLHLCWGHDTREAYSITFHFSPLTHGCYQSERSTNQLSTHISSASTVCL